MEKKNYIEIKFENCTLTHLNVAMWVFVNFCTKVYVRGNKVGGTPEIS